MSGRHRVKNVEPGLAHTSNAERSIGGVVAGLGEINGAQDLRDCSHTDITPEYNRSIPGGLKNAIDWASRPYGKNSFSRKPSAVIGTSPGALGTAIAQQHLRSLLGYCNSPQMNAPEAYIQFTPGLIADDGHVTTPSTEQFLQMYMNEFHAFIQRVYTVLPRNS